MAANPQPAFYEPIREDRPWGEEDIVALVPSVATMKILRMRAGAKGRLQRHHKKNEAGHVLEGMLLVRWVNPKGELDQAHFGVGTSFLFPVGCIHQEEAVTDCIVLEVSSPYRNDREGMEEEYGLEVPPDALPSTTPEEVTVWEAWWTVSPTPAPSTNPKSVWVVTHTDYDERHGYYGVFATPEQAAEEYKWAGPWKPGVDEWIGSDEGYWTITREDLKG